MLVSSATATRPLPAAASLSPSTPIAQAPPVDVAAIPQGGVPAPEPATAKAEMELRIAFEFGIKLSFGGSVTPGGRGDHEGVEAYEDDHDEDDDRLAKLAKGMTKALGRAIHDGLKSFFGGLEEGGALSEAEREQLKDLEHELKHALKDAFKSNRDDDEVDLLGFATDTLAAVQDFANGFGEFFADVFAPADPTEEDAAVLPPPSDPFGGSRDVATDVSPTAANDTAAADKVTTAPSEAQPHERDEHQDHGLHLGSILRAGSGSPQERFERVANLLERLTAQLREFVDSMQQNETPADSVVDEPANPAAVPAPETVGGIKTQIEFAASFSMEASINLVA